MHTAGDKCVNKRKGRGSNSEVQLALQWHRTPWEEMKGNYNVSTLLVHKCSFAYTCRSVQTHTFTRAVATLQRFREKIEFIPSSSPESVPQTATKHQTCTQISRHEFHFKMTCSRLKWYGLKGTKRMLVWKSNWLWIAQLYKLQRFFSSWN